MAQFNSLLVTGNSRFINPINGNARNGIYYVKGTQAAATGSWTGVIPVPALYDGLTIMYYLPYAGSGNATLNLTLSDGTTTGAINCYFRKTERLTTHFPSGSSIVMTYYSAGSIKYDGTATTDNRWVVNASYLDGNDGAYYDRAIYVRATAGSIGVFPYTLVMRLPDGRWESIVTSSSTGTGKTRNTHGFLFGQLAYMHYNETYAENVLINDYRLWTRYTNLVDYRYSFNLVNNATQGFTANKPIYLVGSIGNDGLFYIDANMWTNALPSSADGKIYIYVGDAFDWYRATFYGSSSFKAYVYTNGHIREYSQDAATVGGHTVAKDVPSNAVFTDTKNTAGSTNNTGKLFLVGALEQSANPQTYSNSNCYIDSSTQYSRGYRVRVNNVNVAEMGHANGAGALLVNDSTGGYSVWMRGDNGQISSKSQNTVENVDNAWKRRVRHEADTTDHFGKTTWYQGDNVKRVTIDASEDAGIYIWNSAEAPLAYLTGTNTSSQLLMFSADENNPGDIENRVMISSVPGGEILVFGDNGYAGLIGDESKVICEKMSWTNETVTYSKSSGSWTFASGEYTRSGQVVQLVLQFHGGSSNVSVGSNAINGTVNGIPYPPRTVRLQGYYSGTVLMGELTSSGGFNIRILGAALNLSSSNTATISGTYIVED